MPTKHTAPPASRRQTQPHPDRPSWKSLLTILTLVPLTIGVIFIGAWALDITIWPSPQTQINMGLLFILFSFAASNLLQEKWRLGAGWFLLGLATLVLATWVVLWVQVAALALLGVGLILLGVEFFQQWKHRKSNSVS